MQRIPSLGLHPGKDRREDFPGKDPDQSGGDLEVLCGVLVVPAPTEDQRARKGAIRAI